MPSSSMRLRDVSSELESALTEARLPSAIYRASAITCETIHVTMRDGVRLATDVYLPPHQPAPVVVVRTPYGRDREEAGFSAALLALSRRGYAVVSQDCRGTGDSEPDRWDYSIFELEDGHDLIEWVIRQPWYDGFIGSCGGSYVGLTQWTMATHPAVSTIVPTVSGLGFAANTVRTYMFQNAYARSIGKGVGLLNVPLSQLERLIEAETMAGGYFNEPLFVPFGAAVLERFPELGERAPGEARRDLWARYCAMSCLQRAEFLRQVLSVDRITSVDVEALPALFGHRISHDAHTIPHASPPELCRMIQAPPLICTGWYDWGLNDALATWDALRRNADKQVAARARLIISPYAHNAPGYREGSDRHPDLLRAPNMLHQTGFTLRWYEAVRDRTLESWPTVIYYLMGANEWWSAADWPPPEARVRSLHLSGGGRLAPQPVQRPCNPDRYTYEPDDPTPTVGGSIVSYLYTPGSVDISEVQRRADVLTYTTEPLAGDLDVVGPIRLVLFASSSAVDTDFAARLSDVFPDGRAIQLQNGVLRTRYRHCDGDPQLLEPTRVYRFEIDMWATANRFKAGHRLRLDISSADFPRFDRNSNRGGDPGPPVPALQTIYHDPQRPSQLLICVLAGDLNPRGAG